MIRKDRRNHKERMQNRRNHIVSQLSKKGMTTKELAEELRLAKSVIGCDIQDIQRLRNDVEIVSIKGVHKAIMK